MPHAIGELKQCSRCEDVKHVNEFRRDKSTKDGYVSACKTCDELGKSTRYDRPYDYEVLDEESAAIPVCRKGQWFVTIVDLEDVEYLSQFKWSLNKAGYAVSNIGKTIELMHRLVLKLEKGDNRVVDHINQLCAYNKKSNLRIVSQVENQQNRKVNKNNTSGYRGVIFHKETGKWLTQAMHRKEHVYIGLYDTAIEAARAYDIWIIANRDEHAKTNFDRSEYN